MKQTTRFLSRVASLLLAATCLILTACSDDDNETGMGARQVAQLKALVLDEDGRVWFDATEESGVYQLGLESKTDAQNLVSLYLGRDFAGQAYTRTLQDGEGTVSVAVGGEGVFYVVVFAVKGIPPFTLRLVSSGSNAFGMRHTCSVCGYTWTSTYNRCPREGSATYHPQ